MSSGKLAVVGSANVDLVFNADRFPSPGETILGSNFSVFAGGKGANQAVAAAKLGAEVEFVGKIGADSFGEIVRKSLVDAGVSIRNLLVAEIAPTGTAGIVVSQDGENTIVVNSGANSHLYPDEVESALEKIQASRVLTQFEVSPEVVTACQSFGPLQINPAPARRFELGGLAGVELITPNRGEAELLTGIAPVDPESCRRCAGILLEQGVARVIITLGSEGCFVMTDQECQLVPTISVRTVDTTGAGDTFNGALAAFLCSGRELIESVVLANVAAALSTTRPGAQASMPTWDEVLSVSGVPS